MSVEFLFFDDHVHTLSAVCLSLSLSLLIDPYWHSDVVLFELLSYFPIFCRYFGGGTYSESRYHDMNVNQWHFIFFFESSASSYISVSELKALWTVFTPHECYYSLFLVVVPQVSKVSWYSSMVFLSLSIV